MDAENDQVTLPIETIRSISWCGLPDVTTSSTWQVLGTHSTTTLCRRSRPMVSAAIR
jgi:hypothetical protein